MKLGPTQARHLLPGDVTPYGVVLDCIGDGPGFALASFRVQGEALASRRRLRAEHLVEVTGYDPSKGVKLSTKG